LPPSTQNRSTAHHVLQNLADGRGSCPPAWLTTDAGLLKPLPCYPGRHQSHHFVAGKRKGWSASGRRASTALLRQTPSTSGGQSLAVWFEHPLWSILFDQQVALNSNLVTCSEVRKRSEVRKLPCVRSGCCGVKLHRKHLRCSFGCQYSAALICLDVLQAGRSAERIPWKGGHQGVGGRIRQHGCTSLLGCTVGVAVQRGCNVKNSLYYSHPHQLQGGVVCCSVHYWHSRL